MDSTTQDTITFKKTLVVTHETEIKYDLTYDDFCEKFMERLGDEDDEALRVRSQKVWLTLLGQRSKPCPYSGRYIHLGQEEQETDWDDEVWDGGGEDSPEDECEDLIMVLVESVQKNDEAFKKHEEVKRQKRADELAEQLRLAAEWKAKRLREEEERKEQVRRAEAAEAAWVKKAKEGRLAALRKEMEQIQEDLAK